VRPVEPASDRADFSGLTLNEFSGVCIVDEIACLANLEVCID